MPLSPAPSCKWRLNLEAERKAIAVEKEQLAAARQSREEQLQQWQVEKEALSSELAQRTAELDTARETITAEQKALTTVRQSLAEQQQQDKGQLKEQKSAAAKLRREFRAGAEIV